MANTTKKVFYLTVITVLVIAIISVLRVVLTDAPEGKTQLHYLFESLVGPTGAAFAIFAFILVWMTARSMGGVMGRGLTFFAIALFFIALGMTAFGIHGYNILINGSELLPGELTRYILRTSVMIFAFFAFLGAFFIGRETIDE